jgi:folate-binding Fe-S cluster repair protein YgfZ
MLEYDSRPSEAPPLPSLLKRYVLRSKVRIRDVSQEYDIWSAWGSDKENRWETSREWAFARSGAIEPIWNSTTEWPWGAGDLTLRDRRAPGMGARHLIRKGDRRKHFAITSLIHRLRQSS